MKPVVLNRLQKADCGSFTNVVVAFNVQTLNNTNYGLEALQLALLLEMQQMSRKISQRDIDQKFVAILGAMFLPHPFKGGTGLK